jgi:hypothetical protein
VHKRNVTSHGVLVNPPLALSLKVCSTSPNNATDRKSILMRSQFVFHARDHFLRPAGQFTTSEKLCAFAVRGEVFTKNRPSGATS